MVCIIITLTRFDDSESISNRVTILESAGSGGLTDTQATQLSGLYNKLVNDAGKTTLWTNPSPTSAFAAQTITVSDMTKYTYIIIKIVLNATSDIVYAYNAFTYPIPSNNSAGISAGGNSYIVGRPISFSSSTSIYFNSGEYISGTWVTNNAYCV